MVHKRNVTVVCVIMTVINVVHSIYPLLPFAFVQDVFRAEIFFTKIDESPFFSKNPVNASLLHSIYESKNQDNADIYKALAGIRNVSSKPQIFDTMEIGYYGNTGLCVHNIFKAQDSYKMYKLVYCIVMVVLLTIIVVTYLKIVRANRKSKALLAAAAAASSESHV